MGCSPGNDVGQILVCLSVGNTVQSPQTVMHITLTNACMWQSACHTNPRLPLHQCCQRQHCRTRAVQQYGSHHCLPKSIFLRMSCSPWCTAPSTSPLTANTPPTMAHTLVRKWRKDERCSTMRT